MLSKEDEELLDFDFEIAAQDISENKGIVEKNIEKTEGKADKLISKLDNISKNFEIAETTVKELTEVVVENVNEVKNLPSVDIGDMFKLNMLQEDFLSVRNTLLDTVTKGKMVIDALTNEIIINPTDAEMVAGYSQLIQVVNSSMKLLSSTYKDISDIVIKVKKLEEMSNKSDEGKIGTMNNIQNNFYVESTSDIIKQLKLGGK